MSRGIIGLLEGLNIDELWYLSRPSTAAIIRLIPGVSGGRIAGVRSPHPPQHCVLLFLKPLPPAEDLPDCARGDSGPNPRFG